jgi:periplasmic protein TonB
MMTTEPNLPWVEGLEDRLFKYLVIIFIILFLVMGITLNNMSIPEIQQKKLVDIAPRLAKLILEKKKVPPPPPLKKIIKKEVPKKKKEEIKPEPKKPDPKPKKKAEPKPKPVPKPDSRAAAKKTAQQAGLIALSDELADLRESFDFSDIADEPQLKTGKQAETVVSTSNLLTAKASTGSGGITTNTLERQITTSELAQRKTTTVKSSIQSNKKIVDKVTQQKTRTATRSQEEIERTFQKNKGAIFSIYNRELRKDPSLQGKVVIELTIAANGTVTKCLILSSELGHTKLEKRLVSKIKKFKFANKKVPVFIVKYPIDFLPS